MADRYSDLLGGLPTGGEWRITGAVRPYTDANQEFIFEGGVAGREYKVSVNNVVRGSTVADGAGVALVSVALDVGKAEIVLEDTVTRGLFRSYAHVKHLASILAGQADAYESIDDAIDDLREGKAWRTANAMYLEEVHGRMVGQPNDIGWGVDAYRRLVGWLRPAYRDWGGRRLGLRYTGAAFTSALPLQVPRTWRARWTLGYDLVQDAGRLAVRARVVPANDAELETLNARCYSYVHAAYAGNNPANAFPGPFTNPLTAQRVEATFAAGWDGGAVTVTGTNAAGATVSDVLAPPAVLPGRTRGVVAFATVTSAAKALVGVAAATASLGVEDRFVRIARIGDDAAIAVQTLAYLAGPDRLRWTATGTAVAVPVSATYVLPAKNALRSGADLHGLVIEGAGYTVNNERYLWISADRQQIVRVDLGGAGPFTAAAVAVTVNAALTAAYGAAYGVVASAVGAVTTGPVVRLQSYELVAAETMVGTAAHVAVHAAPCDGARTVFGFPRRATTLAANALDGAVHLDVVAASRLGEAAEAFWPATLDNVASWGAPVQQPAVPTRIAVVFGKSWAGGDLTVSGTNAAGVTQSEVINVAAGTHVDGVLTHATFSGVTNAAPAGGTVAAWIGARDTIGDATRGLTVRVGRGIRFTSVGGTITIVAGTTNTVADCADPAYLGAGRGVDLGGQVRITAGAAANIGLHTVIGFSLAGVPETNPALADGVRLRHQDAGTGGVFANGAVTWRLYAVGDLVRVMHIVTNRLTLAESGTSGPWTNLGGGNPDVLVEDAGEMPTQDAGAVVDPDHIEVAVDTRYLPTAPATQVAVDVSGTNVPDGWTLTNAGTARVGDGYVQASRLLLGSTGAGVIRIERSVPQLLTYRGFDVRLRTWIGIHNVNLLAGPPPYVTVDVDFGAGGVVTFGTLGAAAAASHIDAATGAGPLDPVAVGGAARVPAHADQATLRVTWSTATGAGEWVSIEALLATVETDARGLYVGRGTLVRTRHRDAFGEVIYVWSPATLAALEQRALGITTTGAKATDGSEGAIDRIMPAHAWVDRYDVSDASTPPANLAGVRDETGWMACARNNLTIVLGSPARTSYVQPTLPTFVTEQLAFVAPSNATTGEAVMHLTDTLIPNATNDALVAAGAFPQAAFDPPGSDVNGRERLTLDGTDVPITAYAAGGTLPWRFTGVDAQGRGVVQIASAAAGDALPDRIWPADGSALGGLAIFDAQGVWRLTYARLTRATTPSIDLGVSAADYLWLVDLVAFRRTEVTETTARRTDVGITFDASGSAILTDASNGDAATVELIADDGRIASVVAATRWRFVDDRTVKIATNVLDSNSIYRLSYDARVSARTPMLAALGELVVEHRSGVDVPGMLAAAWVAQVPDDVVRSDHRFHQLRMTLTGITDTRDVEVQALGFRGIRLHGAAPSAPGILYP